MRTQPLRLPPCMWGNCLTGLAQALEAPQRGHTADTALQPEVGHQVLLSVSAGESRVPAVFTREIVSSDLRMGTQVPWGSRSHDLIISNCLEAPPVPSHQGGASICRLRGGGWKHTKLGARRPKTRLRSQPRPGLSRLHPWEQLGGLGGSGALITPGNHHSDAAVLHFTNTNFWIRSMS